MPAECLEAFFLPGEPGGRFCVFRPAARETVPAGGVVYVHPFAEEMNKSRRMAALQARRLAAAGRAVLQIDLLGCGDSAGESGEGRWDAWRGDVTSAVGWLRARVPGPVSLWGLRLGATLAADVARDAQRDIDELLLWQPVVNGEQFLTQFLRLQLAGEMIASGAARSGVADLRAALAAAGSLEVAGYDLDARLAAAIDGVRLADFTPAARRVHWLEVAASAGPEPAPASRRVLDAWRARGLDVRAVAVSGDPFWTTVEIAQCEALLDATDASLAG
ncbi:MAG: hydrolase 2, exosortase A system-associated [Burkholderiales bacterium]|nr:hydrolase 2, exosortase A system-associated [Burkholderiales bacterium]